MSAVLRIVNARAKYCDLVKLKTSETLSGNLPSPSRALFDSDQRHINSTLPDFNFNILDGFLLGR